MGYDILTNGVYWGYNPLANLFLTSWDIQVLIIWPGISDGISFDWRLVRRVMRISVPSF